MSKISISVNIAGREYPLKIKEAEKKAVLKAVELISQNLKDFENNYAVRDKQDLLAMCALQASTQYINAEHNFQHFNNGITERIIEVEEFISEYLRKEKNEQVL